MAPPSLEIWAWPPSPFETFHWFQKVAAGVPLAASSIGGVSIARQVEAT